MDSYSLGKIFRDIAGHGGQAVSPEIEGLLRALEDENPDARPSVEALVQDPLLNGDGLQWEGEGVPEIMEFYPKLPDDQKTPEALGIAGDLSFEFGDSPRAWFNGAGPRLRDLVMKSPRLEGKPGDELGSAQPAALPPGGDPLDICADCV
jgi:hypothetical protein